MSLWSIPVPYYLDVSLGSRSSLRQQIQDILYQDQLWISKSANVQINKGFCFFNSRVLVQMLSQNYEIIIA